MRETCFRAFEMRLGYFLKVFYRSSVSYLSFSRLIFTCAEVAEPGNAPDLSNLSLIGYDA